MGQQDSCAVLPVSGFMHLKDSSPISRPTTAAGQGGERWQAAGSAKGDVDWRGASLACQSEEATLLIQAQDVGDAVSAKEPGKKRPR